MRGIGKYITPIIRHRANRDFRARLFPSREAALRHHIGTVERDIAAIRAGRLPHRHLTPTARVTLRAMLAEARAAMASWDAEEKRFRTGPRGRSRSRSPLKPAA